MTGSGNDFVFIDGRFVDATGWSADQVQSLCDRRTGVGADGLVIVRPGSAPDTVRMTYFNRDGSPAPMCGNAALCATRFAAVHEMANPGGMILETDAGTYRTRCLPGPSPLAELDIGDLSGTRPAGVALVPGEEHARLAMVGVPHLVVVVDDVASVPVVVRGRVLRFDPALGVGGANVNFVGQTSSGWRMRTYERGVEDETLACGTGAVAAAATLHELGLADVPWSVRTASGRILTVSGTASAHGVTSVRLAGECRLVFRAVLVL
ncbi:MAG: diaminopimelate epimerase [Gemmatimonadetes bacterium RBG_16_66_8]|nr:MAG: diaminopimelate epimerase [Gemmatimonadetes bacterium RBG_16_66_8]